MLHEAQRTSAPSSTSVSISTAVWIVMCSEPVMRAPFSGFEAPYSLRSATRPGLSVSAISISLRPHAAREMRSEEHTSELQSLMRSSYAVVCLKKKKQLECRAQLSKHNKI